MALKTDGHHLTPSLTSGPPLYSLPTSASTANRKFSLSPLTPETEGEHIFKYVRQRPFSALYSDQTCRNMNKVKRENKGVSGIYIELQVTGLYPQVTAQTASSVLAVGRQTSFKHSRKNFADYEAPCPPPLTGRPRLRSEESTGYSVLL